MATNSFIAGNAGITSMAASSMRHRINVFLKIMIAEIEKLRLSLILPVQMIRPVAARDGVFCITPQV